MNNTWYSSDPHFGHRNMLMFRDVDGVSPLRNFSSIQEHDEHIIQQHNKVVGTKDTWHCLGDVTMSMAHLPLVDRMNGGKKILYLGNHDNFDLNVYSKFFDEVVVTGKRKGIIFSHIPLHPCQLNEKVRVNVYGHLHAKKVDDDRYLCVSMEQLIDYTPVSLDQIRDTFRYRGINI